MSDSPKLDENNFDQVFSTFMEVIKITINRHAPLRKLTRRQKRLNKKPWITNGILISIKKKQKLYRTHFLSSNPINRIIYEKYSNMLTRVKAASKKLYFHDAIHKSKNSPQKTWEVLNELLVGKKRSLVKPSILNVEGKRIEETKLMAESFNNFFGKVGGTLAQNIDQPNKIFQYFLHKTKKIASTIALIPPTVNEVFNELNLLKSKKAAGSDELAPFFIKTTSLVIAPYMTYFTEFMFNQGFFPNILKIAKVIPIYKSGDKSLTENYRPISLLPTFSKVIEKMIKVKILSFISRHNVFYDRQSGFRKKRNNMYPLIDIITECYDNINNGNLSCIITLDIKKAFDTVKHNILLNKLNYNGIRGPCLKLLTSYLTNRKQYVYLSGYKSSFVDVECGVPQGSVLSPLLFILYVNDMITALHSTPRLFADDTCLFLTAKNTSELEELGNSELSSLKNWMDANKLTVNPTKSKFIVMNSKIRAPQIQCSLFYNNTCIRNDKSLKYLGIELDQELNFLPHLTKLENKLSQNVGIIMKLKHFLLTPALLMLYYSIVYPYILYGIIIWGSTYTSHLNNLQLIQNKAVRAICSLNWRK